MLSCLAISSTTPQLRCSVAVYVRQQAPPGNKSRVNAVLRSDNLSVATHELALNGGRALTKRYSTLLDHYGMKSTRIFPRKAHENGVVEQAHRRTKSILAQMLGLAGARLHG